MGGVVRTALILVVPPIIVALLVLSLPDSIRATLKDFQQLLGGVVALGAAIIGYLNLQDQFGEQRKNEADKNRRADEEQEAARQDERTRLMGALLGEVEVVLVILRNRRVASWFEGIRARMEATGEVSFGGALGISSDYARIYRAMAADVGKLEAGVPEKVTYFYGLLQLLFDRVHAVEAGIYDHWSLEGALAMAQGIVEETREVEAEAAALVGVLKGRPAEAHAAPAAVPIPWWARPAR